MRGRSGHGGMGDSQSRQRVRRQAVEHDPSIRRTVVRSQGQQCHPGQRSARQQGQAGAVKTAATHQEVGGELGRVQVARMWRKPLEELLWSKEAATSTRSGHGGTLCETSAQQRGASASARRRGPTPGPGAAIGGAQPSPGPRTSLLSSVVCCQALLLLQMLRATPTRPSTPRAAVLSMAIRRAGPVKVGLGPQAPPKALAGSPVLGCCTPCWRPSRNLHTLSAGGNPSSGEEHGGRPPRQQVQHEGLGCPASRDRRILVHF